MTKLQVEQFLEVFQKLNQHLADMLADRPAPRAIDVACEETGEVVTTYNLQARPRIGAEPDPYQYQDPTPMAEPLVPPMSLDQILSKFGYPDPAIDDGADDCLDGEDDHDNDFNAQMSRMPYAEREDGLTEMEYALKLQGEDVERFREYQANRDNPVFQQFMQLSPEEQQKLFDRLSSSEIPSELPNSDPSE